jgi:hypothetical protein
LAVINDHPKPGVVEGVSFLVGDTEVTPADGVYEVSVPGLDFRAYRPVTATCLSKVGEILTGMDLCSPISLMTRLTYEEHFTDVPLRRILGGRSVRLRGVGDGPTISEFIRTEFQFPDAAGRMIILEGEVHIVDSLPAPMIMGLNILVLAEANITLGR